MKRYKIESKLLYALAEMLIFAHAAIPHTHHFKLFSSAINLFGQDFKERFEHHNPTMENVAKENECVVRFDFSDTENRTGQLFKKTNPEKKYVLDYQPCKTIDNPPDILYEVALLSLFNRHPVFSYKDCIVTSIRLRAPPLFVEHYA